MCYLYCTYASHFVIYLFNLELLAFLFLFIYLFSLFIYFFFFGGGGGVGGGWGVGDPPVTVGFPSQIASNSESGSKSWNSYGELKLEAGWRNIVAPVTLFSPLPSHFLLPLDYGVYAPIKHGIYFTVIVIFWSHYCSLSSVYRVTSIFITSIPQLNGRHSAGVISKTFAWKKYFLSSETSLKFVPRVQWTASQHWLGYWVSAEHGGMSFAWAYDDPDHWCIYASPSFN